MLTSVQKEILQSLINLYQASEGDSIKGEDIAEVMNRNPGTIRNQMQSLRSLGLVKGVPGPHGGYKPTVEAYHSLNISVSDKDSEVPLYKDGKQLEGVSVARIEFTSVPKPTGCEAVVKVLGNIKDIRLGDIVRVGPTPVNNLGVIGRIVGRDDMENILLIDTKTIRSIPKTPVGDIASRDVITLSLGDDLKDVADTFSKYSIDGAPVVKDKRVVGMFTVTDLVNAISNDKQELSVGELMSKDVVMVNRSVKIADAIELMFDKELGRLIVEDEGGELFGIVTRTDLIDSITNLKQFPIINN